VAGLLRTFTANGDVGIGRTADVGIGRTGDVALARSVNAAIADTLGISDGISINDAIAINDGISLSDGISVGPGGSRPSDTGAFLVVNSRQNCREGKGGSGAKRSVRHHR
jgi:hypothetical protein